MAAFVARELAPAGLRSSPKNCDPNVPDTPHTPDLRLLRSRAGASSLATGDRSVSSPETGVNLFQEETA
ncbi:hypothetical protein EMIT0194MI4_150030 [Pseudomonas sp. IT-194MI4]